MNNGKKLKRILKIFVIDILGYVVAMGTFLAIFYLVPYELQAEGAIVGDSDNMAQFQVPGESENESTTIGSDETKENEDKTTEEEATTEEETTTEEESGIRFEEGVGSTINSENSGKGDKYNGSTGNKYDHIGTEEIEGDQSAADEMAKAEAVETLLQEYSTDNVYFTIEKKEVGSGRNKITYYIADVYVSSLDYLKAALAKNRYGTNIKDDVDDIAEDNNAIFAITGDSYGNNSTGIVVRDGILYRDDENDADVCLLYTDGTMKTYTAAEFDETSVKENNVWQAWCFGPALLDGEGNALSQFTTSSYLSKAHPRVAIGYVAPGHYIFAVVDGRDEGYSRGASLSELAVIMQKEGCLTAYNLDGGGSSSMYFDGTYVNKSTGRDISDIIYIPKE